MLESRRDLLIYLPVYIVGASIYLIAGILQPTFFSWDNNVNLFTRIVPLLLAGIAQMFVLLTGGIDLSIGSTISLTNVVAALLPFVGTSWNILLWFIIPPMIGLLIGLCNGFIISRWQFPPFIVTLATNTVLSGLALLLMDVPGGEISMKLSRAITGKLFSFFPVPLILIILVIIITYLILRHTAFGRSIYALGGNKSIARESGIRVERIEVTTYAMSSLFASFAGMYLSVIMISGDPLIGEPYVMNSIAVAVIGGVALSGGRGGVQGILGAAYIFYLIDNILNLLAVSTFYQYVAKGLIIIFALAITSHEKGLPFRIKGMHRSKAH